jgi:cytochrome b
MSSHEALGGTSDRDAGRGLVWDLPLRLGHWALALAVSGAFVTHWIGDNAFAVHVWCGYAVLVLVAFRLTWGFVGPAHARFADFVRGPRAVLASLPTLTRRGHVPVVGHTRLGGWMILLLLALAGTQATLGLFSNDEILEVGPLMGYVSEALSHRLSGWHGRLANVILVAVALHVAAALWYRIVLGDDLIGPLVSGYKAHVPRAAAISSQRLWLALVLAAGAAAILWWIIRSAPEPALVLM